MTDIDKIVNRHLHDTVGMELAKTEWEKAALKHLLQYAIYEAVEAERGRVRNNVLIWSGEWGMYWRPNGSGYTAYVDGAGIYSRSDAMERTRHCGPEKKIALLPIAEPISGAADDELTTDSEGAGYECRECRHINNTPGSCRNCGFDAYPTL